MASTLISGKYGNDSGSGAGNNWDKFVVKGMEMVAEEHIRSRRLNYTIGAIDAEDGVVFTAWASADGCKPSFWICIVDSSAEETTIEGFTGCHLAGRFRILAQAEGDTYAPRLLKWWDAGCTARVAESKARKERGESGNYTRAWQRRYAEHLATQIGRRGIKDPAPMPEA